MCTLIVLRRPDHAEWPVLIAANRDEMSGRPTSPPGRHWQDRPDVVAGIDHQAGGSWLGINDYGVVAAVLNRKGTLGSLPGKRSRGELVLEALDHADAQLAAEALGELNPSAYRPFNLIISDNRDCYWVCNNGLDPIMVRSIPIGLSIIAAGELNDLKSARIRFYLPLFNKAEIPNPVDGDWSEWQLLLGSTLGETDDPMDGMCISMTNGYETRSSSLVALPVNPKQKPIWRYANGSPQDHEFVDVQV